MCIRDSIRAAEEAMITEWGVTQAEFRKTCGIAAYLDDCTIVAPPRIAAVGLRVFSEETAKRGWSVNMSKTVCGAAYYVDDDTERETAVRVAQTAFHGILRPDHVQAGGQVLLPSSVAR